VVEGELYIKLEDGTSELTKGQIFTTKPGEYHEFQTHEKEAQIIEIMWVTYDSEDIKRELIGGPLEESDKIKWIETLYKSEQEIDKALRGL
jgi:mannose-6-phosphate isomerase-like protein (cupin superfamily)